MAWRLIIAAAVAPALLVALVSAAAVAGSLVGRGLWSPEELTLPEAALTASLPEIERLIGLGADPNRASRVRGRFLADRLDRPMTPLGAAELAGREDVIELLRSFGATVR